jgi:general secretion pathway protein A
MVLEYFKLKEPPFGVTPDARFLFMSATHREALASLLYGVDSGCGFLALIATPGLGKTTLLFHTLNQLREKALTVFLFQTVCTPMDLLRALLTGLGIQDTQGSLIQMQLRLKDVLVEQARLGKRVVVVIDEAQNLDDSVLELIRMLSNFETSREKLIQIILSGQQQLAEKISSPDLEQLRQRVSIFAQLKPFSREDTQLYIEHRLRVAGYGFETPLFTRDAVSLIAQHSGGIPRNINNICFNSLSLACALQRKLIDSEIIREVIADLDLGRFSKKTAIGLRAPSSSSVTALTSLAVTPALTPEEDNAHAVPEFLSAAGTPSTFAGWVPKFAIALLVILALGGMLFASRRWPAQKSAVHAQSATPATAAPPALPSTKPAPEAGIEAENAAPSLGAGNTTAATTENAASTTAPDNTVSVTPGKTLLGICVDSYGKCNPELMQEIRKLNPQLNNLDHIETGQKIRLPATGAIAGQPGTPATAERGTP